MSALITVVAAVAAPSAIAVAASPQPSLPSDLANGLRIVDHAGEYAPAEAWPIQVRLRDIEAATGVSVILDTEPRRELMADDEFDAIFRDLREAVGDPADLVVLLLTITDRHCVGWSTVGWDGPLASRALVQPFLDNLHEQLHPEGCASAPPVQGALNSLEASLQLAIAKPEESAAAAGGGTTPAPDVIAEAPRATAPASLPFLALLVLGPMAVLASWAWDRRSPALTFRAQQAVNRRRSIALVGALLSVLAAVGFAIGFAFSADAGPASAAGLVLAGGGLLAVPVGLRFGDGMMLAAANAAPAGAGEQELRNVVTEMALAANLPPPRVFVIETPVPNAMATGRDPNHATIAVTRGLLDRLTREQLQGVIAHEMAHVRNLDVRYAMLVAVLVGTIVLVTDVFFRGTLRAIADGWWLRFRGKNAIQAAVATLLFLLVLLVVAAVLRLFAPLAALAVQAAASRQREFLADATAVELGRNPAALEGALEAIASADDRMSDANRGISHAYFVHPTFSEGEAEGANAGWRGLFSTHPSILARVNRLRALRGEAALGGALAEQLAAEA